MLYKKYLRSSKQTKVFEEFKLIQKKIVKLRIKVRDIISEYLNTKISNKLNDFHVSPKAYCSILKMFLNNNKNTDYSTIALSNQVRN